MRPREVLSALRTVVDPATKKDMVRLGYVRELVVADGFVSFTIMLDDPGSAFAQSVKQEATAALHATFGQSLHIEIRVDNEMIGLGADFQVTGGGKAAPNPVAAKNIIAVASGKGGVGKSTVSVNLAIALAQQGYDVGLVDTDIYGPSIPTMFGLGDVRPRVNEQRKIIPPEKYGVRLLSMGFMVDPNQAVIWRGPMVSNAVRQFLGDTDWAGLDFLIMDLPPGTGDIQLTIVQTVPLTGAIIVSTPQEVALADARKGVAMFEKVNVPVLGIVENMAYFTPPDLPDRKYYLFGQGGARKLAETQNVPFLGEVPIEQALREGGDIGTPIVLGQPDSISAQAFVRIAGDTADEVALLKATKPSTQQVEILYK